MIRILIFLIVVFILGLGFAWLADRPGELVVTFNNYQYQVTLMVAAVAGVAVVAAVMLSWWILKSLWNSPRTVNRYFRARRRDRGYQSLSTGLIAAGAGDNGLARKMGNQASSLLSSDQEPLIHLLVAQTMLLEGKFDEARGKFEQMLDDPESELLALRGLFLEAQRLGDRDAARHYAGRAAELAPQLTWASNASIETRTMEGDWDGALKLIESQASTKQISKEDANHRKAVLLTAKSMAMIDGDPAAARSAALEAHKLMPEFVPAAVAAGKVLFRQAEMRKGSRILETLWKRTPHPEIAEVYVHARSGDSTHDRLKRARRLQSLKKHHVESALAVARAANDAGEFREAREAIEAALKLEPRESAYLLLADIEENETGDQGRVRHWLAKAVRAQRDPAWTADGYVSESWAPVSPITGAIGAFEWKVPVERLGEVIDAAAGSEDGDIPIMPELAIASQEQAEAEPEPETEPVISIAAAEEPVAAPETSEPAPQDEAAADPAEDETPPTEATPDTPVTDDRAEEPGEPDEDVKPITEATAANSNVEETAQEETVAGDAGEPAPSKDDGEPDSEEPDEPVPLHRIPDDPGVDEEAEREQPSRFRLF